MRAPAVPDDYVITLSVADVSKTFEQVNIHKEAGPDRLPGRVLKACADQLAGVFTNIFNLSLIKQQADHHSPSTEGSEGSLPKRLLPHSTHIGSHEVL